MKAFPIKPLSCKCSWQLRQRHSKPKLREADLVLAADTHADIGNEQKHRPRRDRMAFARSDDSRGCAKRRQEQLTHSRKQLLTLEISFGEMDPDMKHAMSHRADAFRQLVATCFGDPE